MRRSIAALTLLIAVAVEARDRPIHADFDRPKIRAYNIGLTSLFSLASATAQRQVHSWRDIVRHLAMGAGAGTSYYQAKRLTGDGHVTAGWLLANATASVVENTTSGEHPFGRLGYTVGPFRARFATPLVRKGVAKIEMDWSVLETMKLGQALREFDHVTWRNGLIAVDRDTPWPDPDHTFTGFQGRTYGVFPGTIPTADAKTWPHEVVHAVQHQQMDSVEPPIKTLGGSDDAGKPQRLFAFRHIRAGFVGGLNELTYRRPYEERWVEVEAHALTQRTPVPH